MSVELISNPSSPSAAAVENNHLNSNEHTGNSHSKHDDHSVHQNQQNSDVSESVLDLVQAFSGADRVALSVSLPQVLLSGMSALSGLSPGISGFVIPGQTSVIVQELDTLNSNLEAFQNELSQLHPDGEPIENDSQQQQPHQQPVKLLKPDTDTPKSIVFVSSSSSTVDVPNLSTFTADAKSLPATGTDCDKIAVNETTVQSLQSLDVSHKPVTQPLDVSLKKHFPDYQQNLEDIMALKALKKRFDEENAASKTRIYDDDDYNAIKLNHNKRLALAREEMKRLIEANMNNRQQVVKDYASTLNNNPDLLKYFVQKQASLKRLSLTLDKQQPM